MTQVISKITRMMGNVLRILQDEKNYKKDRQIRPQKILCDFKNQAKWNQGVMVIETMKGILT